MLSTLELLPCSTNPRTRELCDPNPNQETYQPGRKSPIYTGQEQEDGQNFPKGPLTPAVPGGGGFVDDSMTVTVEKLKDVAGKPRDHIIKQRRNAYRP